jgi:Mrp family chromosome partitioning ATPase
MELKRYSLIVRRWFWFLMIAVSLAALASWVFVSQTMTGANPEFVALLVALGGLVWGLAGIFGIEFLIDNVKTFEDVHRITAQASTDPLLLMLEQGADGAGGPFEVLSAPESGVAQSYYEAHAELVAKAPRWQGRTVLVCSPQGTPHTAQVGANLAALSCLMGRPTLLIDADYIGRDLSKTLGLAGQVGFAEALTHPMGDVMLHLMPAVPNLHVLPAGRQPAGGHSFADPMTFTEGRLRELIDRSSAEESQIVLVGPAMGYPGQRPGLGPRLAKAADDVVVVVVAEETKRRALKRTILGLNEVEANLTGVIFVQRATAKRRERTALAGDPAMVPGRGALIEERITGYASSDTYEPRQGETWYGGLPDHAREWAPSSAPLAVPVMPPTNLDEAVASAGIGATNQAPAPNPQPSSAFAHRPMDLDLSALDSLGSEPLENEPVLGRSTLGGAVGSRATPASHLEGTWPDSGSQGLQQAEAPHGEAPRPEGVSTEGVSRLEASAVASRESAPPAARDEALESRALEQARIAEPRSMNPMDIDLSDLDSLGSEPILDLGMSGSAAEMPQGLDDLGLDSLGLDLSALDSLGSELAGGAPSRTALPSPASVAESSQAPVVESRQGVSRQERAFEIDSGSLEDLFPGQAPEVEPVRTAEPPVRAEPAPGQVRTPRPAPETTPTLEPVPGRLSTPAQEQAPAPVHIPAPIPAAEPSEHSDAASYAEPATRQAPTPIQTPAFTPLEPAPATLEQTPPSVARPAAPGEGIPAQAPVPPAAAPPARPQREIEPAYAASEAMAPTFEVTIPVTPREATSARQQGAGQPAPVAQDLAVVPPRFQERALATSAEYYEEQYEERTNPMAEGAKTLVALPRFGARLVAVGAKWGVALTSYLPIHFDRFSAALRTLPERVSGGLQHLWTSLQLSVAYRVRAFVERRSQAHEASEGAASSRQRGAVRTPDKQLPPPAGAAARGDDRAIDARDIESWLKAAERSLKRGNRAGAKDLIDRVLDRDPHNEAAWQLRLRLDEPGPITPGRMAGLNTGPLRGSHPNRRSRPAVGFVAALIALGLIGVVGYVVWPEISSLAGGLGSRVASPTPIPTQPAPTSQPVQATVPSPTPPSGAEPGRTSPETGFAVSEPFLGFWEEHGGAPIFGFSISGAITEPDENGQPLTVQYFERARLELRPGQNAAGPEVTLGRLGTEVPASGTVAFPLPEGLRGDQVSFEGSSITTPARFHDFWERNGGQQIFGLPITPVLIDTTPDSTPLAVQYFERARFEYHPENAGTPSEIQLTHLGTQVYKIKHGPK